MRYHIKHTTIYQYRDLVNQSFSEVRLTPNFTNFQACIDSKLVVSPNTHTMNSRLDFYGNLVHSFSVCQPHRHLNIVAESTVNIFSNRLNFDFEFGTTIWSAFQKQLNTFDPQLLDIKPFILDSTYITHEESIGHFVRPIFEQNPILLQAIKRLMNQIFTQFQFKSGATTISTPLAEVMKLRKGVCQDFAHIAIACLRYMGLPAKYISGYLETIPPLGVEKLVGADASHAWVAAYIPEYGWVEFDPTNNIFVRDQHITLATGRDYGDVAPVRGVVYSEGAQQMETSVDVTRIN